MVKSNEKEVEEGKRLKQHTTPNHEEKNIHKFRIPHHKKKKDIKRQNFVGEEEDEETEDKKKQGTPTNSSGKKNGNREHRVPRRSKKRNNMAMKKRSLVESLTNNVKSSIDMVYQACETDETISMQWLNVVIETLKKGINDFEDLKQRRETLVEEESPTRGGVAWSTRPLFTTSSGTKPKVDIPLDQLEMDQIASKGMGIHDPDYRAIVDGKISIGELTAMNTSTSPIHQHPIDQDKLFSNLFRTKSQVKASPTSKRVRRMNQSDLENIASDVPKPESTTAMPAYDHVEDIEVDTYEGRSKSVNSRPSPLSPRHVKLSSPKKSIITYNMIEEKQAKAEANREYLRRQREQRGKAKSERHRAVREKQALKELQLKEANEKKMKKASQLATEHIEKIKEKAFAENQKIDEWRFVASLKSEAQKEELEAKIVKSNMKRKVQLDKKTAHASSEGDRVAAAKAKRNQALHERQEELAAKQQQRERALERRIESEQKEQRAIAEKNKKKAAKALAEKHREKQAKEERAMKLQQKMDNSTKRKDSTLSAIKQRAAASSERSFNQIKKTDVIVGTASLSEKPVNQSKRHKKIRARLADCKRSFDVMLSKHKTQSHVKQADQVRRAFDKLKSQMQDKSNVRKQITELLRILNGNDKEMDGLADHEDQLVLLLAIANKNKSKFPVTNVLKLLSKCCQVPSIATLLLCHLHLITLVPLFQRALGHSEIDVITPLLQIFTKCLHHVDLSSLLSINDKEKLDTMLKLMKLDFVNYLIASSSLELLSRYITINRSAIMNSSQLNNVLHLSFQLFHMALETTYEGKLAKTKHDMAGPLYDKIIIPEMIPLLASFLLYNGRSTPKISISHLYITLTGLRVLNMYALYSINSLQSILADTNSFKHVMNFILRYCSQQKGAGDELHSPSSARRLATKDDPDTSHFPILILNEAVVLLGYFAVNHSENQQSLQFAYQGTTLIQLLARLPIHYFTNPMYKAILVPTLIAICDNHPINTDILQQEMSTQFVFDFLYGFKEMDKGKAVDPFALQNRIVHPTKTLQFFEKLE